MSIISNIINNAKPTSMYQAQQLTSGKKVIIYGAGQGFLTFYEFVVSKCGLALHSIIDAKFKIRTTHYGIMATNLEDFNESSLEQFIVIITIGSEATQNQVRSDLLRKGFRSIALALDFYEYHLAYGSLNVIQCGKSYYQTHLPAIVEAYEMLNDAESKTVFSDILTLYTTREIKKVKSRPISEQYISKDIPFRNGYVDWVNFGAFDGDTVRHVVEKNGPMKSLVCVEPNLINYTKLVHYLSTNQDKVADEIIALPLACSNETDFMRFKQNGTNSSLVANDKCSNFPNTSNHLTITHSVIFDHIFVKRKVGIINFDVEGSEIMALQGLKNIITSQRPDLAVSIYHEPCHLWSILLLIRSMCLDYKFYMRNYTGYPAETILYACSQQMRT